MKKKKGNLVLETVFQARKQRELFVQMISSGKQLDEISQKYVEEGYAKNKREAYRKAIKDSQWYETEQQWLIAHGDKNSCLFIYLMQQYQIFQKALKAKRYRICSETSKNIARAHGLDPDKAITNLSNRVVTQDVMIKYLTKVKATFNKVCGDCPKKKEVIEAFRRFLPTGDEAVFKDKVQDQKAVGFNEE